MMTRTFKNSARKVMGNFRAYQVPISYFGLSHEINNFPHSDKIVYACCTKVIKKVAQERDKESFKSGLQISDETRLTYNCAHLRLKSKKNKNKLSQNGPQD